MRPRRAWVIYLAVLASGGLFALVWLVILMRDINQIEGRRVFPVEQLAVVMLFGLAAHVFLTFDLVFGLLTVRPPPDVPTIRLAVMFTLAFALILMEYILIVLTTRHVTLALGAQYHVRDAVITIVLNIWWLSFVIVQRRLNALIETRSFV
jgi:hypothetical protein